MKETNYSKIARACEAAAHGLERATKIEHLPDVLKQRIQQTIEEIKGHSLEQYRDPLTPVSGAVLTLEEVQKLVIDASGLTKWQVEQVANEAAEGIGMSAEMFRDGYGLDVKDGSVVVYEFYRNTRNRNAVSTVIISCVPGYSFVAYHTDRVGLTIDAPVENNKLKQTLIREVFED